MTKKNIVDIVAKKANLTNKASREAIDVFLHSIKDSLKRGEKVVITGFGTYVVRARASRLGRNPRTGQRITLSARKVPGFIPGKAFKKAIR